MLFGGSGFGFEEDDQIVLEVDELLGGSLNVLGGDRLDNGFVAIDHIVAALVEAVAAHNLVHPEAVVLLAVLAVDNLLLLHLGEGLGIGTFLDVLIQDFHCGVLDKLGAVGVAVDVESPVDFLLGQAAVADIDAGAVGTTHLLADDFEGGDFHAGAELVDDFGILDAVLVTLGGAGHEHEAGCPDTWQ